jgi:hypothetical protein
VNVRIDPPGGGDQPLAGNDLGSRSDHDVDTGLHVGVTRLPDRSDPAILDADVGFDDPVMIEDHGVRDHGVRYLGGDALALPHAVADHLAAAELHFLAVNREVALDLDHERSIPEADPVPARRTVHFRVGAALDRPHGSSPLWSSAPITSPRNPKT